MKTLFSAVSGYLIEEERWSLPAGVFLLGMAAVGLAAGLQRGGDQSVQEEEYGPDPAGDSLLLALWFLCPLVIPWAISKVGTPMFTAKYSVAAVPALFLLASRGLLSLPGRLLKWALILAMIFTAAASLKMYYSWQMEDWRSLAAVIEERSRPDDHLLVGPFWAIPVLEYYYRGSVPMMDLELDIPKSRSESLDRLIREGAGEGSRIWVVLREDPAEATSLFRKFEEDHPDLEVAGIKHFGSLVQGALLIHRGAGEAGEDPDPWKMPRWNRDPGRERSRE